MSKTNCNTETLEENNNKIISYLCKSFEEHQITLSVYFYGKIYSYF